MVDSCDLPPAGNALFWGTAVAEEEYKAARVKYELDLTSAIVSGDLAIIQAAVNMWPFPAIPMVAAAGAATGSQIAIIASNPPKLKYADGGIVPGQPHGKADTVPVWATEGEVILNRATGNPGAATDRTAVDYPKQHKRPPHLRSGR
jgi:hypothetical protein